MRIRCTSGEDLLRWENRPLPRNIPYYFSKERSASEHIWQLWDIVVREIRVTINMFLCWRKLSCPGVNRKNHNEKGSPQIFTYLWNQCCSKIFCSIFCLGCQVLCPGWIYIFLQFTPCKNHWGYNYQLEGNKTWSTATNQTRTGIFQVTIHVKLVLKELSENLTYLGFCSAGLNPGSICQGSLYSAGISW